MRVLHTSLVPHTALLISTLNSCVSHSDNIIGLHDSPVRVSPVVSIRLLSVRTSATTHSGSND